MLLIESIAWGDGEEGGHFSAALEVETVCTGFIDQRTTGEGPGSQSEADAVCNALSDNNQIIAPQFQQRNTSSMKI